jgi:hypothetical protein
MKGLSLASSGEGECAQFIRGRPLALLGKFFRRVMGRGRIIKSNQPSLEFLRRRRMP